MIYKPETARLICMWSAQLKEPILDEQGRPMPEIITPHFMHGSIEFDMTTNKGRHAAALYVTEQLMELHRIVGKLEVKDIKQPGGGE